MCDSCGCDLTHSHDHDHDHDHKLNTQVIEVHQSLLAANDAIAAENRAHFEAMGIMAVNMISSPGSGKTTLLEKTIERLKGEIRIGVIEGDIETDRDAQRIRAKGAPVVQLTTGGACHLDAAQIHKGLHLLEKEPGGDKLDLLFIENVGNLVCPSSYDLGEDMKVVLVSTTEGDDKPLKYPGMFRRSRLMIVNKIDLLPYCEFDLRAVRENALRINGELEIIETSCKTEEGLDQWFNWRRRKVAQKRA